MFFFTSEKIFCALLHVYSNAYKSISIQLYICGSFIYSCFCTITNEVINQYSLHNVIKNTHICTLVGIFVEVFWVCGWEGRGVVFEGRKGRNVWSGTQCFESSNQTICLLTITFNLYMPDINTKKPLTKPQSKSRVSVKQEPPHSQLKSKFTHVISFVHWGQCVATSSYSNY